MTQAMSGHHPAALELVAALGLDGKEVTRLAFTLGARELAEVTVSFYMTPPDANNVSKILRRFTLVEMTDTETDEAAS